MSPLWNRKAHAYVMSHFTCHVEVAAEHDALENVTCLFVLIVIGDVQLVQQVSRLKQTLPNPSQQKNTGLIRAVEQLHQGSCKDGEKPVSR